MVPTTVSAKTAMAAAGFVLAGFASTSQAATVTFDFTGSTVGYSLTKNYSSSGLDLTVSAHTVSDNGSVISNVPAGPGNGIAQWAGLGLGINNSSGDNSHTIDGSGLNDLLVLAFSSSVTFVSATFTYAGRISGSHDGFAFFADNGDAGTGVAGNMVFAQEDIGASGSPSYTGTFEFLDHGYNIESTTFGIGAILDYFFSPCPTRYNPAKVCKKDKFDSFKLASITVDYESEIPPVPLPAGLVLLLSGITGMGLFGRFKNKSPKTAV